MAFAYDSAGNRTSMADGLGSVTYAYDQLSRLTSETRIFTGVGTFPLNYAYNLAGELSGITDPFNAQVGYHYDTAGRLNSVTGSGYGNVSTYASNVQYRAWGGIKGMTYGNNLSLSASYNSGLQMVQFELAGRPPDYGVSTVMKTHADYYADGAIKYAHQLVAENEKFDRAFSYDHVAMLKETYTGSESRDFVNGTNSGEPTGPYRQTYQHDAFGNMTNKANRYWSFSDNFTASYNNQRRQGFQYDAEGNLLQDNDLQYSFDAAGQSISIHSSGVDNRTNALSIDGDGQVLRQTEMQGGDTNSIAYYVRSSVLGGKIITQLDQNGQKQKGYVFAGGELLAHQEYGLVRWHHENPLTGGGGISGSEGWFEPQVEPDATGVNVGFEDPYLNNVGPPPDDLQPSLLGSFSPGKCSLDGMAIACADVGELAAMGNAVACPDNNCGPRTLNAYDQFGIYLGKALSQGFQAFTDGYSGYLSPGFHYGGDGYSNPSRGSSKAPPVLRIGSSRGGNRNHGGSALGNTEGANSLDYNYLSVLPQNSDCRNTVDDLVNRVRVPQLSAQGTAVLAGRRMAWDAVNGKFRKGHDDPKLGTSGFQEGLIANGQGADVYKHIYGVAGGTLIGDRIAGIIPGLPGRAGLTGDEAVNAQINEDRASASRGRLESFAELADDYEGQQVGQYMLDRINGKMDNLQLSDALFHRLCSY